MNASTHSIWLPQENLQAFLRSLSWLVDYKIDEPDCEVIEFESFASDESADKWFSYEFIGTQTIQFTLARDSNDRIITMFVTAPEDPGPRIKFAMDIFHTFRLADPERRSCNSN